MSEIDELQALLNRQAELSNELDAVVLRIRAIRGDTPPACFGEDDCSTMFLSQCPWRIDCG